MLSKLESAAPLPRLASLGLADFHPVSGNTYYRQIEESVGEESVGEDSVWTQRLREALGAVPVEEGEAAGLTAVEARGVATLRLYVETVALLQDAIQLEERAVVEQAKQVIERARYGMRY